MYYVRDAIKKFTASLQPGDLVAMMRTGSGAGASSFKALGGDTVPADEPDTDSDSDSSEEDLQNRAAGLGTFAAMEWIINGLAPVPGRKSIILLSEGFKLQTRAEGVDTLNGSLTDPLRRLTDQASRAGVVIYSIDPRGLPSLALGAADDARNPRRAAREQEKRTRDYQQSQEPLLTLAADTGGRAFMNSNDVDDSLHRVLDDQAGFYLLGYNPEDATFDRKYHKIVVKVKRKGAEVRSRNAL